MSKSLPDVPHSVPESLGAVEIGNSGLPQPVGDDPCAGQRIGLGLAHDDSEPVGGNMAGFNLVEMAVNTKDLKGQVGQGVLNF
jgi:hypothetical protein